MDKAIEDVEKAILRARGALPMQKNQIKKPAKHSYKKGNISEGGRARIETLASILRKELLCIYGLAQIGTVTKQVALIRTLIDMAINGDMKAIDTIFNRTDGRPREIENTNITDRPPINVSMKLDLDMDISDIDTVEVFRPAPPSLGIGAGDSATASEALPSP